MKIETQGFGILEIEEKSIITFKQSIFGFEEYMQFVLVSDSNMGSGIRWLQSAEQKDICFIMLNPPEVKRDYISVAMQDILILLQAVPEDDLDCWVLMVIGETFRNLTVNLKSLTIISHKMNLVAQVTLGQDYPIRQSVFDQGERGGLC